MSVPSLSVTAIPHSPLSHQPGVIRLLDPEVSTAKSIKPRYLW